MKKLFVESVNEAGTEVHSFVIIDRLHSESDHINMLLGNLNVTIRDEDCSPNSKSYLQGIEEII